MLSYLLETHPETEFFCAPCGYGGRRPRPGQGADGYGRKIATDYAARYGGRTRRVYVCVYSNAGTAYVVERGRWLIVREFDFDAAALQPLPPEYRGRLAVR